MDGRWLAAPRPRPGSRRQPRRFGQMQVPPLAAECPHLPRMRRRGRPARADSGNCRAAGGRGTDSGHGAGRGTPSRAAGTPPWAAGTPAPCAGSRGRMQRARGAGNAPLGRGGAHKGDKAVTPTTVANGLDADRHPAPTQKTCRSCVDICSHVCGGVTRSTTSAAG